MAKAEENGKREAAREHNYISMQVRDFPRDLLRRFMNGSNVSHRINQEQQSEETEEEIELSLGLSLNGRFGVDPARAKRLTRSSSIPDFINPFAMACDNNDTSFMMPMASANLVRTCSLPIETEEDWRKRKELQTLRRMEAKRKRSEKQRNMKIARDRNRVSGEENSGEDEKREEGVNGVNKVENCVPFGVQSWVNGGKGTGGIVLKGSAAAAAVVEGGLASASSVVAAPQGSNGSSQGTGSSGLSELETQPSQELRKGSEAISSSSVKSILKNERKQPSPEAATVEKSNKSIAMRNESRKTMGAAKGVKEVVRNVLEDMPCVSTTGDGPNGKRIEGFLYRYRKGEEVRIVCVCHGNFLTPAEFVKHAGGGDVAHPLKHIVVNPYPLL